MTRNVLDARGNELETWVGTDDSDAKSLRKAKGPGRRRGEVNIRGNSVLDQEYNDNLATICCVESGWLDIDNNVSENVQPHIALGRKNRFFLRQR